jgi:mono/diheme cytochrome c family protein
MPPTKISCPSCGIGLRVADSVPAGKKITCPKCGDAFPVPARRAAASSSRVAAVRPRKAPPPPDDEEDLEEEGQEEERPVARRPRRKAKPPKSNTPLIIAIVVGALVLLGGGTALAVVLWPSAKKSPAVTDSTSTRPAPSDSAPAAGPAPGAAPAPRPGPAAPGIGAGSPPVAPPAGSLDFAAGRLVFQAHNCGRCHALASAAPAGGRAPGGRPGMGRGRGPDLSHVGRDPNHTPQWVMEFISDPTSKKPESRMPGYAGKIKEDDLKALADFLASLK